MQERGIWNEEQISRDVWRMTSRLNRSFGTPCPLRICPWEDSRPTFREEDQCHWGSFYDLRLRKNFLDGLKTRQPEELLGNLWSSSTFTSPTLRQPEHTSGRLIVQHFQQNFFRDLRKKYGSPIVVMNLVKRREKRQHENLLHQQFLKVVLHIILVSGKI